MFQVPCEDSSERIAKIVSGFVESTVCIFIWDSIPAYVPLNKVAWNFEEQIIENLHRGGA